jgi:hypothetical protein
MLWPTLLLLLLLLLLLPRCQQHIGMHLPEQKPAPAAATTSTTQLS